MSTPALVANPDSSHVGTDAIPWGLIWEGIELKVLRTGEKSGTYTLMVRLQPGVELPKHRHFGDVHGWTHSGRWGYREYDWVAGPGDYVYEPPNSTHTLYVADDTDGPAVMTFVIDKGMVILGENDEMLTIEDAWSITAMYRAALDNAGVAFPSGVLP